MSTLSEPLEVFNSAQRAHTHMYHVAKIHIHAQQCFCFVFFVSTLHYALGNTNVATSILCSANVSSIHKRQFPWRIVQRISGLLCFPTPAEYGSQRSIPCIFACVPQTGVFFFRESTFLGVQCSVAHSSDMSNHTLGKGGRSSSMVCLHFVQLYFMLARILCHTRPTRLHNHPSIFSTAVNGLRLPCALNS